MPNAGSLTYWYLQLPSLVLFAMIVLLLARLVLSPLVEHGAGVVRLVRAITEPVVVTVGAVTPRIVPPFGVVVCAILWLAAARVVLVMAALAMGLRI